MFDRLRIRARVVALWGVVFIAAIASGSAGAQAPAPVKLNIALSSMSIGQGLSMIAVDGGFFKRENLDVTLVDARTGAGAIQAALSGSVELATGNVDSALNATAQGKLIHTPLRVYSGQPGYLVLSKKFADASRVDPKAPIMDRLKALKGATIASPSQGSSFTIFVRRAAETGGVAVTMTYIASEAQVAALTTGNIDGMIVSSPYAEVAVAKGVGVIWLDGPKAEFPGTKLDDFVIPLSVPQTYLAANPGVVARVIRAYIAASEFVKARPNEARAVIRNRFPNQDDALFSLVWERNVAAFQNVIPTAEAMRRVQDQATGTFAEKIKALDPNGMLMADFVKKAQAAAPSR